MAANANQHPWSFDVSSLMILVGEDEELKYRLSQRSFIQCITAAPVVGLQNYMRSYDLLLNPGSLTYFSPYGCKSAPLRNNQLTNAIRLGKLLEDTKYTVYRIPENSKPQNPTSDSRSYSFLLASWVLSTWLILGALLAFTVLVPNGTWIGIASCSALSGWSIFLRLVEYFNVKPAPVSIKNITDPTGPDAIFIMGRDNSAFVFEGTREDVKQWTSRGLVYKDRPLGIPSDLWQNFTRLGSLLVLLFIFSAIPNGSTMDQVAFILVNALAQLNVLIGQRLNGECYLAQLEKVTDSRVKTRTHIYGNLIRHFKDVDEKQHWVGVSGLLPKTDIWDEWKDQVVLDDKKDPKVLYSEIDAKHKGGPQKDEL